MSWVPRNPYFKGLSRSTHCVCPGTHTFKEGLSRSVHSGCPGTHTLKEGLSRSIHCGCTGTHLFFGKKSFHFHFQVQYVTIFMHRNCFFYWCIGPLQQGKDKSVLYVSAHACVCVWLFPRLQGFGENVQPFIPCLRFFPPSGD